MPRKKKPLWDTDSEGVPVEQSTTEGVNLGDVIPPDDDDGGEDSAIDDDGPIEGYPPPEPAALGVPAKPEESKAQRFERLAQRRVTNALWMVGLIKNLANRSQYEYTDVQSRKLVAALYDAVKEVDRAFAGARPGKQAFTF